ncbi:Glycine cleavage system transcriptional activator [Pigmentiphaga humi]|uniref:Glycine cleavage system transcriptional activator n=2 Tax=Pigmentiphaga humi TaxID=2478468 RepID=A0A3P4AX68_9BURK|nr:Glycine cleavage system transcriptional activator [Pigmentiphaga humi]
MNAVRMFEVAARHVNFTKAAEELHVTHGAVSRQVALLEAWLGVPLFLRSASQLALTDAGRDYLEQITMGLDLIAVASMQARQQSAGAGLRVNAPPTFMMRWLIPRLSRFQRARPEIDVRLTTSIAPVNFQDHGYDLAIRTDYAPLLHCCSIPVMSEVVVPVCHADLLEWPGLAQPEDLARHTLLSYATESYSWSEWLHGVGCGHVRPVNILSFEQMYFSLQATMEGLGVMLVPLFLVLDDIIAGRLVVPLDIPPVKRRTYYVSYPNLPAERRAARAFRDWLVSEGADAERSLAAWMRSRGWSA